MQPDSQEASKIIRNWSQKLPTSSQDRHLGCIWRPLGRHLGAQGRHLDSSSGSWAPSWLIFGLLVAILLPKMSQHSSDMSQDSPNSSQHRPKRSLRDPRDLVLHCRGTPQTQSFQTSVPMRLKAKGPAAEAQPYD